MATIDGMNRGTASLVESNGDRSMQLVYNGDKIEKTTGSVQGSLNANSCNVAQCVAVCRCDVAVKRQRGIT